MKCYSLVIDPKLVKAIDKLVKEHGIFSSRSDFIRDAIRQRLIEVRKSIIEKEEREIGEEEREAKIVSKARGEEEYKFRGVH